jgi:hypothetical protein
MHSLPVVSRPSSGMAPGQGRTLAWAYAISKFREKQAAGRLPSPYDRNDAKETNLGCAATQKYTG